MASNPPAPSGSDPSVRLPPGALPPKWPPKLTRQQWWYVNKPLIVGLIGVVAFIIAAWTIYNVPIVSTTDSFEGPLVTADHRTYVSVASNLNLAVDPDPPPTPCAATPQGMPFFTNDTAFLVLTPSTIGTEARLSVSYSDPSGTPILVWVTLGNSVCWLSNTSASFSLSAPSEAWPADLAFQTPVPTTVYLHASYSYLAPLSVLF